LTTKPRRDRYKTLLTQHLRRVYNFCFRMTLDHTRAASATEEVFLRAYVGEAPDEVEKVEVWLIHIANHVLEQRLPRTPEVDFDLLDETLRSEATRTDVVRSLTDPQRDFMLWELKQGCMTSVVNCLSPGERAAFVASNIMKMSDEAAAAALGVTSAAFKVRLSRARKKVGDYLAPRCEHVNPMNPCRCPARVGVALRKGFIRPQGTVQLRQPQHAYGRYGAGPEAEDQPERDVQVIYGNLPEPDVPAGFEQQLLSAIENGQWDRVRDKKLSGKP
jgi:RNA polymerase sigma factor (sigma-70 family)